MEKNTFTDPRDGKVYKTVKIGNQVWMAENLNYECGGSVCYENDPANAKKYGRLYNWETAKKACPPGWHLPTKEEWQALVDFAGGKKVAGKKLKAKNGWAGGGNGTDEFGFAALPGGSGKICRGKEVFAGAGYGGSWWSCSELNGWNAYYWYMKSDSKRLEKNKSSKKSSLYSVRCVKNKTY